jgi:hypothetical protein
MGWAWFVEMHLLLGGIHLDFVTLVIVIVIMLIVLNLIKASIKLIASAAVIAVIVYFAMYILPTLI